MSTLRRLLRHDVLTPADERELAKEIRDRRHECWRLLFGDRRLHAPLAEFIAAAVGGDDAGGIKAAVLDWSGLPPDRRRADTDALAAKVQPHDGDGTVLLRAVNEIRAMAKGQLSALGARPGGLVVFPAYARALDAEHRRLERAKNKFTTSNMRLVANVVRRFVHRGLSEEDLIQEGSIGLMKAVERFDHRKGFRFSTYATWWIRHALGRAIAKKARLVRLPVHVTEDLVKLNAAERKAGGPLTPEQMAAATGLPVKRVRRVLEAQSKVVSADAGECPIKNTLEDSGADLEALAEQHADIELAHDLMLELTKVDQDLISRRFGLGDHDEHTLAEIGKRRSLSRERIRQLQDRALGKMARAARD